MFVVWAFVGRKPVAGFVVCQLNGIGTWFLPEI
jgi:hypothetical protein